jgi:hypothetical protein
VISVSSICQKDLIAHKHYDAIKACEAYPEFIGWYERCPKCTSSYCEDWENCAGFDGI